VYIDFEAISRIGGGLERVRPFIVFSLRRYFTLSYIPAFPTSFT
jgi:hypothetical protein